MYVVCSDDKVSEVVGQIETAVLQKRRKQKRPTTITVFLQQRVIFSLLAAAAADDPGPEFLYGVYISSTCIVVKVHIGTTQCYSPAPLLMIVTFPNCFGRHRKGKVTEIYEEALLPSSHHMILFYVELSTL